MTLVVPAVQGPSAFRAKRRIIYVQAGQLVAVSQPAVISTILGSCVAICLWDERMAIGGMNHFMLPFQINRADASPRFGTVAWQMLLGEMAALGAQRSSLRAGIFGGACVMDAFRATPDHVGARNVELAEQQIAESGIALVQREVGGSSGRKLVFETDLGRMIVKELKP